MVLLLCPCRISTADDFEWSVPLDGFFISAGPWTQLTGTSSAPPGSGDRAIFNEAGSYTATFTNNRTTQFLDVEAGEVTFRSSGTDRTYTISDNASLTSGGELYLGVSGDPLDLNVLDDLRVRVGRLDADFGSEVEVGGQLLIGDSNLGDGTVNIVGGGSSLTASSTDPVVVGETGSNGSLSVLSSATAAIGGDLEIADSFVNGTSGSLNVAVNAQLDIAGDLRMVTGTGTGQLALLSIFGGSIVNLDGDLQIGTGGASGQSAFFSTASTGSQFNQTGAGSVDVGAATNTTARLDVDGGAFSSGTGPVTVHATGVLATNGGAFTANGPTTIQNGGTLNVGNGSFEATAGLDNSHGGTFTNDNGTLTISGGEFMPTPEVTGFEDFTVTAAAAGDRPKLVATTGGLVSVVDDLRVGADGTDGDLEISAGGRVNSGGGSVGVSGGDAGVLVTGEDSLWDARFGNSSVFSLLIGGSGTADVEVREGGVIRTRHSTIGSGAAGSADVLVTGSGSQWQAVSPATPTIIGNSGSGTFRVSNGSTAEFQADVQIGVGSATADGSLQVLFSNAMVEASSDVFVGGSDTTPGLGSGDLLIQGGGTMVIGGTLRVWDSGSVQLNQLSSLQVDSIRDLSGGTFSFVGGTLQVNSFSGDLTNQGGALSPGPDAGPTSITGNYVQQPGASLAIDIGGTIPGGEYDVVTVTGTASIDGDLTLAIINDFVPEASDTFTVFSASSLNGFFDNVFTGQRLAVDGGSFVVNYGIGSAFASNQIVLSAFLSDATASGDYNGDGLVDGGDFVVWRELDGMSGLGLAADGDGDGDVDTDDYAIWTANYGLVLATPASIPEPSGAWLLALAVYVGLLRRR